MFGCDVIGGNSISHKSMSHCVLFKLNLLQVSLVGLWQIVTRNPQCLQSLILIRNTAQELQKEKLEEKGNVFSELNHHTAMQVLMLSVCTECAACYASFTSRLESNHHTAGRTSAVQAAPSDMTSGLLITKNQCETKT